MSERLRELERQQRDLRFHRETAEEARRTILGALPQIVAAVEQVRCRRDPWGYSRCAPTATADQMCESCAALAALREALIA